jgi:DNA-binding SARP family transcriptional activator
MEFAILGPLEARDGHAPIELGPPRQRALLALLLLRRNEVVPQEVLIEELWPNGPPGTAAKIVQLYVSDLRKTLDPDRRLLVTQRPGYRLALDPEQLDAARFERLAAEARGRPPAEAAARLRDALALWRGPALTDFAYEPFAQAEIARLEELRLASLEDRIEADLELGRDAELVAELEALVATHPLRERLRAQLMRALYRSGRQAEALQTFAEARRALVDELGIEPGAALRELQRRILEQDPGLETPVAAPAAAPPTRKLVTVVHVELSSPELDAEVASQRLAPAADAVAAAIERYGGEPKRHGAGSIAGTWGVARVREDDARRALRAAEEARAAVAAPLAAAVSVVSAEAVVADGAVLAALRRTAAPGELVVSEETRRLASEPARRRDAPLVGRDDELAQLTDAFARVVRERSPRLFTLLGPAGIGKSRLAYELSERVDAKVAVGRCGPYGDALRPARELLVAAGADADAVLAQSTREETFWAARRALEDAARARPLLAVVDDLQWAEPTLLALVEHVADLARDAQLMLLCLARPELVDARPAWGGGKLNATSRLLEPLGDEDARKLAGYLAAGVEEARRERVVGIAEGNPLFLEQLLAVVEETGEAAQLPPTIHALLAARLDLLEPRERETLQRAAVIGREFWRAALGDDARVDALVRKELVRPAASSLRGEEAYRFRHGLVRDAAYRSVPMARRAGLHEAFAAWRAVREPADDEGIGWHLEQAALYRSELGEPDRALARRASELLARGGLRARARSDEPSAATLLGRAVALLPEGDEARHALLPPLADARRGSGDFDGAAAAIEEALGAGDERIVLRARLARARLRLRSGVDLDADALLEETRETVADLERLGDEQGLADAWYVLGWIPFLRCRGAETDDALRRTIEHARRAGDDGLEERATIMLLQTLLFGPAPVPEAIRRCEDVLASNPGQLLTATACRALGGLKAMAGEPEEARELLRRDREILQSLGLEMLALFAAEVWALVELLAGDAAAAEHELQQSFERLAEFGEIAAPTMAAILAEARWRQGRHDEAYEATEASERLAPPDDLTTQVQWRGPRAKVLAARGERDEAERLAREAVELAERTDFLNLRGDALANLAEVTRSGLEDAAAAYTQKGNAAALRRLRLR